MTEQLHRLIDSNAKQPVINERIAALIESNKSALERIGSDHEKRIRFLKRTVAYGLGAAGVIGLLVTVVLELRK